MARGRRAISPRWSPRGLAEPPPVPGAPAEESDLAEALSRNIEAVARRRAEDAAGVKRGVKIAMAIGRIIGRMRFVYANLIFYSAWVVASQGGIPGIPAFDRQLYLIGSIASVESIFLSIFILIAQNSQASAADRRDDLNLQVSLLAEHEVTQLIKLTAAIAAKLGIDADHHGATAELQQDVKPEDVLDKIEQEEPDAD
jgi:uncharacterized membrane protein